MEADNVRVLQALKHLQLIVDHLLIALDVLLQDNLHRDLALRAIGLADNAVCARTKGPAEAVLGSFIDRSVRGHSVVGAVARTSYRSCRAGRAAC